jgi:hypothetical protein
LGFKPNLTARDHQIRDRRPLAPNPHTAVRPHRRAACGWLFQPLPRGFGCPTAIGKKNWLFFGEAETGERGPILYPIIEACRMRQIDPWESLRDVPTRLPTGMQAQTPGRRRCILALFELKDRTLRHQGQLQLQNQPAARGWPQGDHPGHGSSQRHLGNDGVGVEELHGHCSGPCHIPPLDKANNERQLRSVCIRVM